MALSLVCYWWFQGLNLLSEKILKCMEISEYLRNVAFTRHVVKLNTGFSESMCSMTAAKLLKKNKVLGTRSYRLPLSLSKYLSLCCLI